MSGPRIVPAGMAVWSVPSAYPIRSRGALEAISASAAAMKPDTAPCARRRKKSWGTVVAKPMRSVAMASPRLARTTISFRPWRSPSTPQTGVATVAAKNGAAKRSPLTRSSCPASVTPSVRR